MSEHDANRGLRLVVDNSDARKGVIYDGAAERDALEDTQPMPICHRRMRQREGAAQHALPSHPEPLRETQGCVIDESHKLLAKLRERRKPATVGERQPLPSTAHHRELDRQAVIDFLFQGSEHT